MLTLALMLMLCACMASCGTSGSTGTTGTAGFGNAVITETKNDAADAEIPSLSVGYLTEEAYDNGNFAEDAITKTIDFSDREARYMVVDLKIKTLVANSGDRSVKITVQTSDASALYMMVQDAPTGKFEPFGNREGYHLVYSIPTVKGEEKAVRMILKLIPSSDGQVDVSGSISGEEGTAVSGKTGAKATFLIPSDLKYTVKGNEYVVSGLGGAEDTTIFIAGVYGGKPVTGIAPRSFRGCRNLTSIVIADGVTSIGDEAFRDCRGLTSISIPAGVTSIGDYALEACSSLTSIQFGGTVAQWSAISFGTEWNDVTGSYTVTCTDGTVSKN